MFGRFIGLIPLYLGDDHILHTPVKKPEKNS